MHLEPDREVFVCELVLLVLRRVRTVGPLPPLAAPPQRGREKLLTLHLVGILIIGAFDFTLGRHFDHWSGWFRQARAFSRAGRAPC